LLSEKRLLNGCLSLVTGVLLMLMVFAALKALTILRGVVRMLSSTNHDTALHVKSRVWIAKYDVDEGNRALADKYDDDTALSY